MPLKFGVLKPIGALKIFRNLDSVNEYHGCELASILPDDVDPESDPCHRQYNSFRLKVGGNEVKSPIIGANIAGPDRSESIDRLNVNMNYKTIEAGFTEKKAFL